MVKKINDIDGKELAEKCGKGTEIGKNGESFLKLKILCSLVRLSGKSVCFREISEESGIHISVLFKNKAWLIDEGILIPDGKRKISRSIKGYPAEFETEFFRVNIKRIAEIIFVEWSTTSVLFELAHSFLDRDDLI